MNARLRRTGNRSIAVFRFPSRRRATGRRLAHGLFIVPQPPIVARPAGGKARRPPDEARRQEAGAQKGVASEATPPLDTRTRSKIRRAHATPDGEAATLLDAALPAARRRRG